MEISVPNSPCVPSFLTYDTIETQMFPLTIENANNGHYNIIGNLSSSYTLSMGSFYLPACNGTGSERFTIDFKDLSHIGYNGSDWPSFGFEFDRSELTATWNSPAAWMIAPDYTLQRNGKVKITFNGKIDSWHSDVMIPSGPAPSWNLTVGYDPDYFGYNPPKDSGAGDYLSPSRWVVAVTAGFLSATFMVP